jgi:cell division protein FtsB
MSQETITAIIGAASVVIGSLLTAFFVRRKTQSEAKNLMAGANKLIAEAERIQAETDVIIRQNSLTAIKELVARIDALERENAERERRIDELESNEMIWKRRVSQLEDEVQSLFKKFTAYCVGNRKLIRQIEELNQIPVWTPSETDA